MLLLPSAEPAAQPFPVKPVRLVVPFVPGGSSDVIARLIAPRLGSILGQQVIVDNRPGAAGNIAVELTARAVPDGHTMMLAAPGALTVNPLLYPHLRVAPLRELTPISTVGELEHSVTVTKSFPARELADLIRHAREHPDKVLFGSSGIGTTTHLAGALFALRAGIALKHVPYRGAGQAMTDLIAGHLHVMFDLLPSSLGHIRSGAIRALATTGAGRSAQLPDVPTVSEAILPGFVSTSWHALMAPAQTPPHIVAMLSMAVNQALSDPQVAAKMQSLGARAIPKTPDATAEFLRQDAASRSEVIRASHITIDNS